MNCADLESLLDELIEARLDPGTARAAEEHLRGCAACRRSAEGLRRVLDEARSIPASVDPVDDLWPAIERRLAPRGAAGTRRFDWRVLAAAAVLAAGFVLAGLTLRPREETDGVATLERTGRNALASGTAVPARFDAAEQALLATKRELRETLAERRAEMSPRTAEAVDRNLELIEQAIDEIRLALAQDPTNPRLNRMLLATHQRELALLQRVTHPRAGRM